MRCYGHASRAGVGGQGLDLPLDPPPLSPQQAAARQARRVAALEAVEAASTGSRPGSKRRPHRSRSGDTSSLHLMSPVAAAPPAPDPETDVSDVLDAIEDLLSTVPVRCGGCGLVVAPQDVVRTGERSHELCRDRPQEGASDGSTAAGHGTPHQLVGTTSGGRV